MEEFPKKELGDALGSVAEVEYFEKEPRDRDFLKRGCASER